MKLFVIKKLIPIIVVTALLILVTVLLAIDWILDQREEKRKDKKE